MFWSIMRKIPKRRGKRVFLLSFLDPSSPRLAFGCLGHQKTSMLSNQVPQMSFFAINRCEGGWGRGLGSKMSGIERREKEEEERRGNEVEALLNRESDHSFISFLAFFVWSPISFYFWGLNVIYVPLGVPLVDLCTFIFSIYHRESQFLCKVQS